MPNSFPCAGNDSAIQFWPAPRCFSPAIMNATALLARFLELTKGSSSYFVSGSFSFLSRLHHYREPEHDLDIAVDAALFGQMREQLHSDENLHRLSLPEVALADASFVSWLPARTSFVHINTPEGLLDCAQYVMTPSGLSFTLGPGLRLTLPQSVLARVETITWQEFSYRAGPVELAFIPKAIAYAKNPSALDRKHVKDLRRLSPLIDPAFLEELAQFRGLHLFGRPLPRGLDPFARLPEIARKIALRFG